MPTTKYAAFDALSPYFELVQKGLSGLVDGSTISTRSPMTPFLSFSMTFPVGLGRFGDGPI
jgi:hypothetical protein